MWLRNGEQDGKYKTNIQQVGTDQPCKAVNWNKEFVFYLECERRPLNSDITSVVVFTCVQDFFDISPFKRWSLISLPLRMG